LDSITWRPVVDNNTRAAMLQTGEAQFAFPIPYEQAPLLAKNSKLELVASPSIMQRYISMNVTQKPFDNPKVREAINYAINRQASMLRSKKSHVIGMIIPKYDNRYFGSIAERFEA
ncbi:hypothetical protein LAN31_21510, partial [Mycobacterium tuberculosis]|nr:hypothetical protein [Mycobacterium tuberculosis]